MLFPANTGFGVAELVTERFGPVPPTIVEAVAVLFEVFGSVAEDATETESEMTVPLATPVFTLTTIVKFADVDPDMLVLVQVTLPVPPVPGDWHVHPAGALMETKVVFAGTEVVRVALSAALGPASVTPIV